jgi:ATP-dependent Clp protease ATP-binding subunit ClpA
VFERFSSSARSTVVFAQEEARRLNHAYIGTEHVLLGLLCEPDSTAGRSLRFLGIGLSGVRGDVEAIIGRGQGSSPVGHIPFTPRAKKVLELSLREALQMKQSYIGTEHILLGLVREGQGVAAQILVKRAGSLDRVRAAVAAEQGRPPNERSAAEVHERTPGAGQVLAAAEDLAGGGAVGTQHLLEALARSDDTAAAKALAAVGVDADALAAALDEVDVESTVDVVPEEAAARAMELRVEGDAVHVVLRDANSLAVARGVVEAIGGPLRGSDPVGAGAVVPWNAIVRYLVDVQARVTPAAAGPLTTDPPADQRRTIVQRALRSRMGRRGGGPSPQ